MKKLFALCLCLLMLCGCGKAVTEVPAIETAQPAEKPLTRYEKEALAHKEAIKAMHEQYEADGWVPVAGEVCKHGDPFDFTDTTFSRTAEDGTVETVHICNYKLREFQP